MEEVANFFAILRSLPLLKSLFLYNFNTQDMDLISSFVRDHPTLHRLHLHFTSGTVDTTFLDIAAEAPVLENISIDVQSSFPFGLLLSSSSITEVSIPSETFHFDEEHFVSAMQAIESNQVLTSLDMKPQLSRLGIRAMAFGLEDNKKLQYLRFSYLTNETEAGVAVVRLGHALSQNKTLLSVENYYSKHLQIPKLDMHRVYNVLESNETLVVLALFDNTAPRPQGDEEFIFAPNGFFSSWFCGYEAPCMPWKQESASRLSSNSVASSFQQSFLGAVRQSTAALSNLQSSLKQNPLFGESSR